MIPNSWTKTAKELGVPAAAMFVMFIIGNQFVRTWATQAEKEGAAKQELLEKFVSATLETNKEQAGHIGEMKTIMTDLRGLNRKARESDAELLATMRRIETNTGQAKPVPAPKAGGT
jgi:hypothetical protein